MSRRREFTISGWIGDYWLAPASDLKRLVPCEPEVRYDDRNHVRWSLVASFGVEILRAARDKVGEYRSPTREAAWDVDVQMTVPEPLRPDEEWIVESLFNSEAVVTDHDCSAQDVINGRHRMFFAQAAGATHLPVRSQAVSGWSHEMCGDPGDTRLAWQVSGCAYLFEFGGRCARWRGIPDADTYFLDSLGQALDVGGHFLRHIAADAARVDPAPRRIPRR